MLRVFFVLFRPKFYNLNAIYLTGDRRAFGGANAMRSILRTIKYYFKIFGFRGLYFAILSKLLTKPKEVQLSAPGIKNPILLRLKTSDISTYKQIIVDREYDIEISEPPKVILDAGANIGLASIYFANRFPEAKIIAVEPELSNYYLLKKNTAPYQNIIRIQSALWKDNTSINLVDPDIGNWGFQTHSVDNKEEKECYQVQGLTVDKIMHDYAIDFIDILKVDIEGAEKEVFEDASRWIDRVGILTVELHEQLKSGCNLSFYHATSNFELKCVQGEKITLARREKV